MGGWDHCVGFVEIGPSVVEGGVGGDFGREDGAQGVSVECCTEACGVDARPRHFQGCGDVWDCYQLQCREKRSLKL